MNIQYKTLDEVLKAGHTQLRPGLIVELPGACIGRVVQMPSGWQLRSHENVSMLWINTTPDPRVFLMEVGKKFTKTRSSTQKQGILTSATLSGTRNNSLEDMKMQSDIDDVNAKIKAAKKPGAYNGPGTAPHRGVAPTSVPLKSVKAAAPKAAAPKAAAPKATAPKATAPKAATSKAAAPKAATSKEKNERTQQAPRHSAAAMFKKLILDGKLSDDQIFAAVAAEFGLDAKKRSYVAWYRADLKKNGLL